MTDVALIATNTKNPAASSRIWPIERRRTSSGVTTISHHKRTEFKSSPGQERFPKRPERQCGQLVPGARLILEGARRSAGGLTGQILLEPMDVVVAVDNVGFADQR